MRRTSASTNFLRVPSVLWVWEHRRLVRWLRRTYRSFFLGPVRAFEILLGLARRQRRPLLERVHYLRYPRVRRLCRSTFSANLWQVKTRDGSPGSRKI